MKHLAQIKQAISLRSIFFVIKSFCKNFPTLFLLFITLQTSRFIFFEYILKKIYRFAILQSGYIWITNVNQSTVFSHPSTIVTLIILPILFCIFVFLIYTFLFLVLIKLATPILSYKGILRNIFTKIFSTQFFTISLYLLSIAFPSIIILRSIGQGEFLFPQIISNIFSSNIHIQIAAGVLSLLVIYMFFRLIFSLYIFLTITNISFLDAMYMSMEITSWRRSNHQRLQCFCIFFTTAISVILLAWIQSSSQLAFSKLFEHPEPTSMFFLRNVLTLIGLIFIQTFLFVFPLLVQIYGYCYILRRPDWLSYRKYIYTRATVIRYTLLACIPLISMTCIINYHSQMQKDTLIIAHRGDTNHAIENTTHALYDANKKHVDYVETDLQMTKDNQFVMFHDYSIYNYTGIDKKISELTLAEIQNHLLVDGEEQASAAAFTEYIATAKFLNQPLLLDVKTIGKDRTQGVKRLIQIINEYNFADSVIFQSQSEKILQEIKQQMPDASVGLILTSTTKFSPNIMYDFYSVDNRVANLQVYNKLAKHKIFVWTLNNTDMMQPVFDLNMEAIITDTIDLASTMRDKAYTTNIGVLFWNIFTY